MKTEVAIVGGGPGGSTAAMYLIRKGIKPIIIEKESFPRYHIGESMTGECGGILRDLGLTDKMTQANYPIKHGVKVYGENPWFLPVMARTSEGQLKDQTTWQVRRSQFDQMMLNEAVAQGATLIEGQATRPLQNDNGDITGVQVRTKDGSELEIKSELLIDASGQNTFLANAGVTGPKYRGNYDKQMAIFSQVVDGIRDDGDSRDMQRNNTLIFYKAKYHWGWWIPIDEEVVSVGIVSPSAYFLDKRESKKQFLTRELHELHPEFKRRLPEVKLVEEARSIPNYSFQVKKFCGRGYLCLGDAHRFVDPIFSFGLYVTMKEAQFAAGHIVAYLDGVGRDLPNPLAPYQTHCEKGIDVLEDTLDGFWEHPNAFAWMVYSKFREQMIDVFAGRIYDNQPSTGVQSFRKLLNRERVYDNEDIYSIPIGSRYHPERAPLWDLSASIEVA